MVAPSETFRCAICKEVFTKGWSEEEARAEQAATWEPRDSEEDMVCEDCFPKLLAWARAYHPEFLKGGGRAAG